MQKAKLYTKRKLLKILGFGALTSTFGYFNLFKKANANELWQGEVLNSHAKIQLHMDNEKKANFLIENINKLIKDFDNTFNLQNELSEIFRLNRDKYLEYPSKNLVDVINKSMLLAKKTNGIFDVTVQPLWNMYYDHFIVKGYSHPPEDKLVRKTNELVNFNNVEVKNDFIKLHNNSSITLNGLAQGWITDYITDYLKKNGVENTLVDFGEIYAMGKHNDIEPWKIIISNLDYSKKVDLTNRAISTSAGNGTSFESSHTYHHIFNPKTGLSSNIYRSVSIISKKAWISDAISTASMSMDTSNLKKLCKAFDAEAYILKNNNFKKLA